MNCSATFFAVPSSNDANGQEIGAVRGVLGTVLSMIEAGATHVGVATDHVVESFRNDLYPGYKTSEGVPPELLSQFPILEEALQAMGVVVWPMVEFEADDALASAAAKAALDERVEPGFHLHARQRPRPVRERHASRAVGPPARDCARRSRAWKRSLASSRNRFPIIWPLSETAQMGFPAFAGWGTKAAAIVLSQYPHLEDIPKDWHGSGIRQSEGRGLWRNRCSVRGTKLLLFRTLATLRLDVPVFDTVDELAWREAAADFEGLCRRIKAPDNLRRATARAASLAGDVPK